MNGKHLAGIGVLVLTLLLAGCSRVSFLYNQLDWLLPTYVNKHVTLDTEQKAALDKHVDAMLAWHCATEVSEYADWFGRLADAVAAGDTDRRVLARLALELEVFWYGLVEQAAPRISDLLYGADDAQVAELFASFAEKNREMRRELVDAAPEAVEATLTARMTKRFERWLGEVTPAQRAAMARWHARVRFWQAERLAMRERWQAELRRALAARGDRRTFERRVYALLRYPERVWSPTYRDHVLAYRQGFIGLLQNILANAAPSQRDHAARRLRRWEADLRNLACPSGLRATGVPLPPAAPRAG